jgi:hypothetical protein
MTTTCAYINTKTGLVENLIIASPHDPVDEGYILIPDPPREVVIGDKWNGKEFELPLGITPPAPKDPDGLEML